jgi:glycosyltransferase involved in cell wall biosynthesis
MRILYVAPSIPVPGFQGGSTHVHELSKHLIELGHNVCVLSRRMPDQSSYEVVDGIHIFPVWRGILRSMRPDGIAEAKSDVSSVSLLAKDGKIRKTIEKVYFNSLYLAYLTGIALQIVKKCRIDVILERGDSYGIGAVVSMLTNRPLITEVRDIYQPKISLIKAKNILTYDSNIIKNVKFRSKAIIMHGGVDVKKFRPLDKELAKERLRIKNKFVIGYAGSFMKTHQLDDLFYLAKVLCNKNIHFLMVGPYASEFREKIEKLELSDLFTFTGPVRHDELPVFLSAMDVAVAFYDTSKMAGPPYKVYEYLACGLPSIITANSYSERLIQDSINGFLISDAKTEVISKILALIEDPVRRGQMSIEARKTALKCSWAEEAKILSSALEGIHR